jgi:hypothetical protein
MRDDPIVIACERWKKRILAAAVLLGTAVLVAVGLLLEAHTLTNAWEFVRWGTAASSLRNTEDAPRAAH